MNFCSDCGAPVRLGTPEGDHRERYICDSCHAIHYQNPRLIVGCIPVWEREVLLCKRANEPRCGFWTLPAGFLELGETVEQGAARETYEEARARVEIGPLFSVYSIPSIGQVYLFFLADLLDPAFGPTAESALVRLFPESEIPWDELAFSSVRFTLERYFKADKRPEEGLHIGSFYGENAS